MSQLCTHVWEFQIRPEATGEFERNYGSKGAWVELFRRSEGYLGTLLLKDRSVTGRYLTIDQWQSEDAYRRFRAQFSQEYADLDKQCEGLTVKETSIGTFNDCAR